ncbi:MAG TPA: nitrogenase iron-molybdenum cofactor biosynthesis protein NifE [Armatimonadota bacterium]|jgi:nitrogenase molybdenum-cofactor synthesis protein NifE
MPDLLVDRAAQVHRKGQKPFAMDCDKASVSGSVSQRACVFCGSRVVLYPIVDALHLVHGPIGCAAYTWDIRGALSSGPELHRHSFSTDLRELDVVFGGEVKLREALLRLIERHQPKAAFVYSTCIVGVIGDDVDAVCRSVSRDTGIPVLPVDSPGFKGTKKDGYAAACAALFSLVGSGDTSGIGPHSVNLLGDFNLAGEIWIIRKYLERMGVEVVAGITGDGRVADIQRAHGARLNLVQCSGSTVRLARMMEDRYQIAFRRVSYFGVDDMSEALYEVARFFGGEALMARAQDVVREELAALYPQLLEYRKALIGKRAALYVGGAFKAHSLVKALRLLGMEVVMVGSQTGSLEDYQGLERITDEGTIIVDDSNPLEMSSFLAEKDVDLFIGGVKERPIAYKLGVGFCDHNHQRQVPLEGFVGMLNFAKEVHASVTSPVWRLVPRRARIAQPLDPGAPRDLPGPREPGGTR